MLTGVPLGALSQTWNVGSRGFAMISEDEILVSLETRVISSS
jgi:hypothetical protein